MQPHPTASVDTANSTLGRVGPLFGLAAKGTERAMFAALRRRFILLPVLAGMGIACWFSVSAAADRALLAALISLALAVTLVPPVRTPALQLAAFSFACLLGGMGLIEHRAQSVAAPVVARQMPVTLEGIVQEDVTRAEGGRRLVLKLSNWDARNQPLPVKVRLTDRIAREPLLPGQAVRLRAVIGPPNGPARPGGYDFARRAWFSQIGGIGFTLSPPEVMATPVPAALERLAAWRAQLSAAIRASMPPDSGAVAAALIAGDRSSIPTDWNEAARDSGIAHILSISGLHLALVTGLVMASVRALLAAVPALAVRLPVKSVAAGIAACAAIAYTLLSGAAPPTIRSCLVCLMVLAALAAGREPFSIRTLAFAAAVVLLLMAEAVVDVSTQMSFAAVGGLIALASSPTGRRWLSRQPGDGWPLRLGRPVLALLAASLVCELALAPIAFHHFGRTGLYGLLANLIAVPLTSLVIMPAGLIALLAMPLGLEAAPLWLMGQGIEAMIAVAKTVAGLPLAVLRLPALDGPGFALAMLALLWLILVEHRSRWLAAPVVIGTIALSAFSHTAPVLWVGDGARLAAVTLPDGRLAMADARGGSYARSQWLEGLGQGPDGWVPPASWQGADRSGGWRCNRQRCTINARIASADGLTLPIIYLRSPRGFEQPTAASRLSPMAQAVCPERAVIIARFAVLDRCPAALAVFDADYLAASGPLSLAARQTGDAIQLTVTSVSVSRGTFPWAVSARTPAGFMPQ